MIVRFPSHFARATCAALVTAPLVLGDPAALAGDAAKSCRTYRPIEAVTADLGSKSALAYFVNSDGACHVALLVSEKFDPEREAPRSATRLDLRLDAGRSVSLESETGGSLQIACGREAAFLSVATAPRDRIESMERKAAPILCALDEPRWK